MHAIPPEVSTDEVVRVYDLPETEDAKDFAALWGFYTGAQHDHCPAHWDGSRRGEGQSYYRERYLTRGFVPIDAGSPQLRKPDVVTPLAREIVETLTALLLSRTPQIHVPIDQNTASFYARVWEHGKFQAAWTSARNMAGAARAAVVVAGLVGGRPTLDVVPPSECRVLRWSDREQCQPALLVRQRLIKKTVNDEHGKPVTSRYWRTCAWDEHDYITYDDVREDHPREEPLRETTRIPHGCERCPATWYRNTGEGGDKAWGRHDFDQLEGRCDAVDRLGSQLCGSVGNNTDPTMFHADEEGTRRRHKAKAKGRGVLIELSEKGRVGFAEINATSIDAAQRYLDRLEESTLAMARCIRITPDLVAAAKSGKHMQVLFLPAQNRAALLGIELADAIVRVLECFYEMAMTFGVSSLEDPREGTIILPSRIVRAEAQEEGEHMRFEVCAPGRHGAIEVRFGAFFEALPDERNTELTGLQGASGGEAVLSRRTAIEGAARVMGVDPVEERRRIAVEEAERTEAFKAQAKAIEDTEDERKGGEPGDEVDGEDEEDEATDADGGDEEDDE